jgi:uncharacterized membrane protein
VSQKVAERAGTGESRGMASPGSQSDAEAANPVTAEADASTAAFHTAMAHLYRGEMHRLVTWRQRLDTTSHWAIILSTALTTFALGTSSAPHYVLLLALAFDTILMIIEGRRYQHVLHSKWRLGMLERNYFAPLFSQSQPSEDASWRAQFAADLSRPHFTVSLTMGTRLRLRRNYLMIMAFVMAAWTAKLFIHPGSPQSLADLFGRLALGEFLPPGFVAATAALFMATMVVLVVWTPSEEALEQRAYEDHARRALAAQ